MTDTILKISKTLSPNDVGATGSHQAGILVPKIGEIIAFFPSLPEGTLNPRRVLMFYDNEGQRWEFHFIYYNNQHFGGTRNEYRLTRMTPFFRAAGLVAGDIIVLSREASSGRLRVDYRRESVVNKSTNGPIVLGSSWKVINF